MRKSNLPIHRQTPLDQQATKKRLQAEETEKILALGQESELKAKPWVKEEFKKEQEKEKEYFFRKIQELTELRKKKKVYFRCLVDIFLYFASQEDISGRFMVSVDVNDIGMKFFLKPTKYYGAIKFTGIPAYDFHACKLIAVKLGNTVAKLEGYLRKTEAGIIVPDQEDIQRYGRS